MCAHLGTCYVLKLAWWWLHEQPKHIATRDLTSYICLLLKLLCLDENIHTFCIVTQRGGIHYVKCSADVADILILSLFKVRPTKLIQMQVGHQMSSELLRGFPKFFEANVYGAHYWCRMYIFKRFHVWYQFCCTDNPRYSATLLAANRQRIW